MRKDAKAPKTTTLNRVQGYHEGGFTSQTNYAFLGFTSNKYFTGDRFIKLDQHFNRPDGKPLKGFGLEIETECRGLNNATVYAEVLSNIIFKHFPDDLFKLQHDGSLGGDTSAECITQVMTREFIRNHYQSFRLMYDTYFPAFGISCSRSGNCGMHVNISNGCFGRSQSAQEKGFMNLEDFTRQLCLEAFTPDDSVVYHFRISTQAGITPAMTHPFPLTTRLKTCTQLDLTCPCGVAHNGIIQLTSNPREKTYSDTVRFITRYLTRLVRGSDDLHDQPVLDMIYLLTNSKFAIMDTTGYVATVGDFIHAGGLLFSNNTFIESPVSYTASRKYSSNGKVVLQP